MKGRAENQQGAFRFGAAFETLTSHAPFPWQQRLFDEYFARGLLPPAVAIPTGLGKTAVTAVWLLARAAGAALPRRLVYVVDRRTVVDQAIRSGWATASMAEVVRALVGLEIVNEGADVRPQGGGGAGGRPAQQHLELGKQLLDRVQIGGSLPPRPTLACRRHLSPACDGIPYGRFRPDHVIAAGVPHRRPSGTATAHGARLAPKAPR